MTTIHDIPNEILASIIKFAGPSRDVQCVSKRFSGLTAEVALDTFKRLSNAEMADDEYYLLRHVFQEVKAEFPLAETVGDVAVRALDTLYKRLAPHYPNKTFEEIHTALNRDFLSQFEKECQEESLIEFASILEEKFYTGTLCRSFETTQEQLNHIRTWLQQNAQRLGNRSFLEFSSRELTRLPREIGQFLWLINLTITATSITFLPKEFWQLQNITYLYVKDSPLEFFDVPEGNVSPLFRISLCNTKLNKYPKCVERFASTLRRLSLKGNGIKSLPESIGNLTGLQHFNICNNPLKTLPRSIGTIPYIHKLKADWKNIPTLCDEVVFASSWNVRMMPEIYAYRWYGPVVNYLWPIWNGPIVSFLWPILGPPLMFLARAAQFVIIMSILISMTALIIMPILKLMGAIGLITFSAKLVLLTSILTGCVLLMLALITMTCFRRAHR